MFRVSRRSREHRATGQGRVEGHSARGAQETSPLEHGLHEKRPGGLHMLVYFGIEHLDAEPVLSVLAGCWGCDDSVRK